ncbi:MAG TPA: UDP-N-acetylglucosamine 2-epimerase (non-hydrolyzing) [Kiritimatiellia bacterium]|nr:UDP-N-acetylglucosamine 2-epimerase (non-hydrolyzing) [Kiritimatiellia bacterium]
MKICSVVGARPNFIKIAPFCRALRKYNETAPAGGAIGHWLVHTGQHYDDRMSQAFFHELGIPQADVNLGIGSGSHAEQVGKTMIAFEKVVRETRPDWIVVVGDVNATCACSIVAKKEHVQLAHIEAGLRSFDLDMPEEINRLVTDRLSDLLFVPDRISEGNLLREGVPAGKIRFVGNIMIDTLREQMPAAGRRNVDEIVAANRIDAGIARGPWNGREGFALVTLHRPSNVDDAAGLRRIADFICGELASDLAVLWPIHPRAKLQLETHGLWRQVAECGRVFLLRPLGYHDLLKINMEARLVVTDSGGLQEECCVLGTPCLTLRPNTERPVTLLEHGGVSLLVGNDPVRMREGYRRLSAMARTPMQPELWDGHAAERIVRHMAALA